MSQQRGQQPRQINWQLTFMIIALILAITGPIPGFWENLYKQFIVIADKIFQSPPVQKNGITIRKELPVESQP